MHEKQNAIYSMPKIGPKIIKNDQKTKIHVVYSHFRNWDWIIRYPVNLSKNIQLFQTEKKNEVFNMKWPVILRKRPFIKIHSGDKIFSRRDI